MSELKVLGISGSLRKASYNTALLKACAELMPAGMKMTHARIDDIPLFNQDVFDAGLPEPAKRFRAEVAAADGLLIASPEYNFSASQGPMGGARVQYDLRRILGQLWGHVLPRPEVFIGAAQTKVDAQGKVTDEATKKFLADLVTGLKTWIERMQVKK